MGEGQHDRPLGERLVKEHFIFFGETNTVLPSVTPGIELRIPSRQ